MIKYMRIYEKTMQIQTKQTETQNSANFLLLLLFIYLLSRNNNNEIHE